MADFFMNAAITYDPRFLEDHAGSILKDPTTAIVELVANAWDAYATKVDITWPTTTQPFSIEDNGLGMNEDELNARWRRFSYNRVNELGENIEPPPELVGYRPRKAFGRNGKGRFAAFCFSSTFELHIGKDGKKYSFLMSITPHKPEPFSLVKTSESESSWRGFKIVGSESRVVGVSAIAAKSVLSTRFLTNPEFEVFVDGDKVTFEDIPSKGVENFDIKMKDGSVVKMTVIDSEKTDRTTKQHGIAWWVTDRLVGACDWKNFDDQSVLDGRREEAKRYTFILRADHLKGEVLPDWSGFVPKSASWIEAKAVCEKAINEKLLQLTATKRAEIKNDWISDHQNLKTKLPKRSQERLTSTMDQIMQEIPSLAPTQVQQVMNVLANMEMAQSQYSLLEKMQAMSPSDLDDWNEILDKWTLELAKEALDEVEKRLRVLAELARKTTDFITDEVQELQPLFERSLWIFGPQFESIEFTSNVGMTRIVRELFNGTEQGLPIRPDFVVIPDGTAGFYSRPDYDRDGNETGCAVLSIIELKRPGVALGSKEKDQVWKYVKELERLGYINRSTRVYGHILGDRIADGEDESRKEWNDSVVIKPWLYSNFISQGEKRMFQLKSKLANAPFLREYAESDPLIKIPKRQTELDLGQVELATNPTPSAILAAGMEL